MTQEFLKALSEEAEANRIALTDVEKTPDIAAVRYQQGLYDALSRVAESPDDFMEMEDDDAD